MAKRFLCYDTDNPQGVTPEGVLDPNAMGGSAEFDLVLVTNTTSQLDHASINNLYLLMNDNEYISKTIDKIINKEPVNIILEQSYFYGDGMVYRTIDCFDYMYNAYGNLVLKFIGTTDDITPCIICVYVHKPDQYHDNWYIGNVSTSILTIITG